ncbi:MAG: polysaccharide biosynthesis tyrosine autokinase [Anaerolineaceae bacterium]
MQTEPNSTNEDIDMEDGVDLRRIFAVFWHYAWLIALAGILTGLLGFLLSRAQTPIYQSTSTVLIDTAPSYRASEYSMTITSTKLADTYMNIMSTDTVIQAVQQQLGLKMSVSELTEAISIAKVGTTDLIKVTVETTDAEQSALIANAVVEESALQIQEIQQERFVQSRTSLETQITDIEQRIEETESEIDRTSQEDERLSLEAKLTQYREIYANLILSLENLRLSEAQNITSLVPIQTATPNPKPVKPEPVKTGAIAAVIGLLVTAGVIFLIDMLDDTIKTPDDITRKFHLPVLGIIFDSGLGEDQLVTIEQPRSPTSEAYRTLRTNINFSSVDRPLHTLLITSSGPNEGKTTIASNLAVAIAQSGKHVILADTDLRLPKTHAYFGLSNRRGLTTLFTESLKTLDTVTQETSVRNLVLVTTGALPPNPAELLGSNRMQMIIDTMREKSDLVILDTPPVLVVADAAVLAPTVDGVLIVVTPGITHERALERAITQLSQVNARVLGVVLNKVKMHGGRYGYDYYYKDNAKYQSYYGDGK